MLLGDTGEWSPRNSAKCIPAAAFPSSSRRVALSKRRGRRSVEILQNFRRYNVRIKERNDFDCPCPVGFDIVLHQAQDEQLDCVDDLRRPDRQARYPLLSLDKGED